MIAIFLLALVSFAAAESWNKNMENPGLLEGDIVLDPDEKEASFGKWNGYASIKGGRWPNARIPYTITSSIHRDNHKVIKDAIAEYEKHTCIRFQWRSRESSYLSFYRGRGCSSPVGWRSGRRNDISLADGCLRKGIVMHEIGHSIGLYHEQSRPDRDNYVYILWNNIYEGNKFNFNKQPYTNINSLETPYDFESMMHYGSTAFGINNKMTIQTKQSGWQRFIGQRNTFSKIDIQQINKMYCATAIERRVKGTVLKKTLCKIRCCAENTVCGTGGTGNVKPPPPAACVDKNKGCPGWAKWRQCETNPGYMLKYCRKSCGKC